MAGTPEIQHLTSDERYARNVARGNPDKPVSNCACFEAGYHGTHRREVVQHAAEWDAGAQATLDMAMDL